jgi:outer membrane receptor protein involved in Fe transport
VDAWTTRCDDPFCAQGPAVGPGPADGYVRYRAADHRTITDDRQLASVLSLERRRPAGFDGLALGWARTRTITSLGGRDDESHLGKDHMPLFGFEESPKSEPFYVYLGDEPYFSKSWSESFQVHGYTERRTSRALVKAGAGMRYDEVALRALDVSIRDLGLDSLRSYHAWAPGGFAYLHGRWWFEGLAANAGMRLEYFTAGPQAEDQSLGAPARGLWTLSPRLGFAYPMTDRDAFSLSYVRLQQAPPRDFLYDSRLQISNRQPLGNPVLGPSTSISWQAALKHRIDAAWSVQAALFYRDLYGVIVPRNVQPARGIARLVYEDDGSSSASGIELSAIRLGERARVEVHYTWMEARGTFSSAEGVPYGPRLAWRPGNIGQHPLDWDRRHTFTFAWLWRRGAWSGAWSTTAGSPLPWTPAERRTLAADDSRTNSRRLSWEESSSLAVRRSLPWMGERLTIGLDVLNVFDRRNERAASVDGYPNPVINTVYDDYAAYREETGLGGGAYWNDGDGDGAPGWRPVHDPRLHGAPRSVRLYLGSTW